MQAMFFTALHTNVTFSSSGGVLGPGLWLLRRESGGRLLEDCRWVSMTWNKTGHANIHTRLTKILISP